MLTQNNNLETEEKMQFYKIAAAEGDAEAQSQLGLMYIRNNDFALAYHYFHLAADQQHPGAQANLGMMHYNGNFFGVVQDYELAAEYYRAAAKQGSMAALSNLGGMYLKGDIPCENHKETYRLLSLAAEKGSAAALVCLGLMYQHGIEVKQNPSEALRLFALADEKGAMLAKSNISLMFKKNPKFCSDLNFTYQAALVVKDKKIAKEFSTCVKKSPENFVTMLKKNPGIDWEQIQQILDPDVALIIQTLILAEEAKKFPAVFAVLASVDLSRIILEYDSRIGLFDKNILNQKPSFFRLKHDAIKKDLIEPMHLQRFNEVYASNIEKIQSSFLQGDRPTAECLEQGLYLKNIYEKMKIMVDKLMKSTHAEQLSAQNLHELNRQIFATQVLFEFGCEWFVKLERLGKLVQRISDYVSNNVIAQPSLVHGA